jgi:hypothetical protein
MSLTDIAEPKYCDFREDYGFKLLVHRAREAGLAEVEWKGVR